MSRCPRAFHEARALLSVRNARGYWGADDGAGGRIVCSVWTKWCAAGRGLAFIPAVNKGNYRVACESLLIGDDVMIILRKPKTDLGAVMPVLWRVLDRVLYAEDDHVGYLVLQPTSIPTPLS